MSGIDDAGTPPEVPEEYAATYRDAYLRALQDDPVLDEAPDEAPDGPDLLVPLPPTRSAEQAGRTVPLLVGGVIVLVIAVVLTVVLLSGGGGSPTSPAASTPTPRTHKPTHTRSSAGTSTTASVPAGDAWQGTVIPVTPDAAVASCTAPPGVDSAGTPVTYEAAKVLDSDVSTAWRCVGSATGVTLTLTLPAGTAVGELGLIPGYAKTDPKSGIDRYAENNRITQVRWTLADGVSVVQDLDPSATDRGVQTIRVPRTVTGTVTLEVLAVKKGPRNTTAISEVEVQAAG